MSIHIDIFGTRQVMMNLTRGSRKAANMTDAMNEIADDMMRVERATFTGQGRRYGGSWHFLKVETIKRKIMKNQDPRILMASQALFRSLTQRDDEHQILDVGTHSVEFGTDLEYADTHQYGDESRGIPARPFIEFYPQDERRWSDICARKVVDALNGH